MGWVSPKYFAPGSWYGTDVHGKPKWGCESWISPKCWRSKKPGEGYGGSTTTSSSEEVGRSGEKSTLGGSGKRPGNQESLLVLHNNWVIGSGTKKKRAQDNGHWFLTADGQRCSTGKRVVGS